MIKTITYSITDVEPYINWLYFFHAWGMSGKSEAAKENLKSDAVKMLAYLKTRYHTHAVFGLFTANSENDDLLLDGHRIPMLRQQHPKTSGQPNLSLSDYVHPLSSGISDTVGAFATTIDSMIESDFKSDEYNKMMAQIIADRLAEATAERLHEEVRKHYWGYAPQENLTIEQLHREEFQGIRPAIGYPSLPDTSVNFELNRLLNFNQIGITLTENGMMRPHASVSGLMFSHPKAQYFDIGEIGEDQLQDYAHRRGIPVEMMRRFLRATIHEDNVSHDTK